MNTQSVNTNVSRFIVSTRGGLDRAMRHCDTMHLYYSLRGDIHTATFFAHTLWNLTSHAEEWA